MFHGLAKETTKTIPNVILNRQRVKASENCVGESFDKFRKLFLSKSVLEITEICKSFKFFMSLDINELFMITSKTQPKINKSNGA